MKRWKRSAKVLLVRAKETPTCKAGLSLANQEGFTERLKGRISVSGNAVYGETLTAQVEAQPDARFHYQWKSDGAAVGTDSPNYQIQGSDLGRQTQSSPTRWVERALWRETF